MEDGGYRDEKIIAIPFGDPTYNGYKDIKELPEHIFSEMTHFFSVYKALEGKKTALDSIQGPNEAKAIIKQSIEQYKKVFSS